MAIPDRDFGHIENNAGLMVGYVDRFGVERDMAGNAIAAGSRPVPGAFRQSGLVFKSAVAVPNTGNTNENTLATIAIPAGAISVNGGLRVRVKFSYTGSTNVKTLRARFGGTLIWSADNAASAANVGTQALFDMDNRGVANSQIGVAPLAAGVNVAVTAAFLTAAIDTTQAQNLTLTAQLATGSETITLESYTVEILNP